MSKNPFEKDKDKISEKLDKLDETVEGRELFLKQLPELLKNNKHEEITKMFIEIFDGFHMMIMKNKIFIDIVDTQLQAVMMGLCPNVRKSVCEAIIALKEDLPEELVAEEIELLKSLEKQENEIKKEIKKKDVIH